MNSPPPYIVKTDTNVSKCSFAHWYYNYCEYPEFNVKLRVELITKRGPIYGGLFCLLVLLLLVLLLFL